MIIELANVSKKFGRVEALKSVTTRINAGQRVALIGPNGSGKSTLIRILMGLLRARGEAKIDGRSPFRDRLQLAHRMAVVPQIAPRLNATVGEMIHTTTTVRRVSAEAVKRVSHQLHLEIEPIRRRPFRDLSGGMKQKLLIALAFAAKAELLILDEPTASLDAHARDQFFQLFHQEAFEATLLLCSHRLEEIRHLVDHVIALDEGTVSYDGPGEVLLGGRAMSVIEVCPIGDEFNEWLTRHEFHPGRRGWWSRTVTHDEKMQLLPALTASIDSTKLKNLLVRELATLDLSASSPPPPPPSTRDANGDHPS